MAAPVITEEKIRSYLLDRPELNPLLNGVRWSTEDIENAMILCIDYCNSTPPYTGINYTIENFPYSYLLLTGTVGQLLRSAAINEASNQFNYSADGVQVQDKDKAGIFTQLGNMYWQEFQENVKMLKLNQSALQVYGTINSEYIWRGIE